MKLNIGCEASAKSGWIGLDKKQCESGISFPDGSVDYIFSADMVQTLASPDALRFFDECRRVLKPDGVIRICVPSVEQVLGAGLKIKAARSLILEHGSLSVWNESMLLLFLHLAGFRDISADALGEYEMGKNSDESIVVWAIK